MSLHLDLQVAPGLAGVPGAEDLRRFAAAALAAAPRAPAEAELSVRVVDAGEMAALNARYRGRSGPTNELSFPFEAPPGVDLPFLGDLVVCAPVVAREAREQGKLPEAHWAHMVVHGVLHLLGHDHQTPAEAEAMEALERTALARLGFPDPYTVQE